MIVEKGLSVRQCEDLTKLKKIRIKKKKKESDLDYYFQSVADKLKGALGTKIDIKRKFAK